LIRAAHREGYIKLPFNLKALIQKKNPGGSRMSLDVLGRYARLIKGVIAAD
jgi:hypothetical protein